MLSLGRRILTPYCAIETLAKRYPGRPRSPDVYCPNEEAYYQNGRGKLRMICLGDWSIWESIPDEDGWPSGCQVKIWPRTKQSGGVRDDG